MPATITKRLLEPQDCALILIDHQSQMLFGAGSHPRAQIVNNVVGLAKAAKVFSVPTILTTVARKSFSGPLFPELSEVFPGVEPIDRTTMNSWEDAAFVKAVRATGKKKLLIAALWTEVCLAFPALSALDEGYEVYAVTDASGGVSAEAHEMAIYRMFQAGVHPVTWEQVMYEWQRDWARAATADQIKEIITAHCGAFGQGIVYAKAMFGAEEGKPLLGKEGGASRPYTM